MDVYSLQTQVSVYRGRSDERVTRGKVGLKVLLYRSFISISFINHPCLIDFSLGKAGTRLERENKSFIHITGIRQTCFLGKVVLRMPLVTRSLDLPHSVTSASLLY